MIENSQMGLSSHVVMGVGWIGAIGSKSRLVRSARLDRNLHWLDREGIDHNIADYPDRPDRPDHPDHSSTLLIQDRL